MRQRIIAGNLQLLGRPCLSFTTVCEAVETPALPCHKESKHAGTHILHFTAQFFKKITSHLNIYVILNTTPFKYFYSTPYCIFFIPSSFLLVFRNIRNFGLSEHLSVPS
jgi:hypothetical protein